MFKASHQRPSRNASHTDKACANDFVQRGLSSKGRQWDGEDFVSLLLNTHSFTFKVPQRKENQKHYTTYRCLNVLKLIQRD